MTKKQLRNLDRVIKQSFRYQEEHKKKQNEERFNHLMNWNKENLSPTGGKNPFKNERDN